MTKPSPNPTDLPKLIDAANLSEEERRVYAGWLAVGEPEGVRSSEEHKAVAEELKAALQATSLGSETTVPHAGFAGQVLQNAREAAAGRQSESLEATAGFLDTHTVLPAARASDWVEHENPAGRMLGKYRVIRKLGHGGMGVVFEAEDCDLKRRVALKTMSPRMASVATSRERFLREARAAARVEHDHVCPIYQVGEEQGIPFIAMPLLQGESLESRLKRGRLTTDQSLRIAGEVARGLAAAHAAGLIHRDIKPANVWIGEKEGNQPRVLILDFGLAHLETEDADLTQTGAVMGTPAYMAPEQARGQPVDFRADLFSMGALLYETLTGQKAFSGSSSASILSSLILDTPRSPSELVAGLPPALVELTMQLLEKDPARRGGSAAEIAGQLEQLRGQLASAIGTTVPRNASPDQEPGTKPTPVTQSASGGNRSGRSGANRWNWRTAVGAALLVAALLGVAAAGILVFQTRDGVLVVEFDEQTDLRFREGKLQVHDESGTLRYTIGPDLEQARIAPGNYRVSVVGADGMQLSTDRFEMTRGDRVILRVTSREPGVLLTGGEEVTRNSGDVPSPVPIGKTHVAEPGILFPGKSLMLDDFSSPAECQLPILTGEHERRSVADQRYVLWRDNLKLGDTLDCRFGRGVFAGTSGAVALRYRMVNGSPFLNFGLQIDEDRARWLTLDIDSGIWRIRLQSQDFKQGQWVINPVRNLLMGDRFDPSLINGKWIEMAARWSARDFEVWLNGQYLGGGPLPEADFNIGRPGPLQLCGRCNVDGEATIEIDYLALWDQTGLTPAEAASTVLPLPSESPDTAEKPAGN